MREVEAAALAVSPTHRAALPRQPPAEAAPAHDAAMAAPDDDIIAFAEAQGIDLDSLPLAANDFARAGIAAHLRNHLAMWDNALLDLIRFRVPARNCRWLRKG